MSQSFSRRKLMLGAAASLALARGGMAAPAHAPAEPVFVFVFLRGAMDGLSALVPYREATYYEQRRSIAIPAPGKGADAALDLDGQFALHPALGELLPAYRSGQLAFVHAAGSHDRTRSHFDAQDFMELGTPGQKRGDGWLARTLAALPRPEGPTAFALEEPLPRSLAGVRGALALDRLARLRLERNGPVPTAVRAGFARMYQGAGGDVVHSTGADAFALLHRLEPLIDVPSAARYPERDRLATALADVARLVKARIGRVFTVSAGNWDTHRGQGASEGALARNFRGLAGSLTAFREDLGKDFDRALVLVVTEFGRTVRQNGTGGTDHGHGGVMLAFGANVLGKKVYGTWPGLAPEQLFQGRDLAVTTDFRDVFAEVAEKHLGVGKASALFPGFAIDPANSLGFLG